jgi:hypothetical protein
MLRVVRIKSKSQKNLKTNYFSLESKCEREREREREWESAMADESRLGRYRRTVVGYVAGQLGGEKSWTFFFQTLVIIFSSAVGRKPCLPPPPLREKKGGVMESKENSFLFCFRFGIFSFHNVSGSIPGALYTIRNTTGDWQVNDFHTPFGMLIIMPCPIIGAELRIMDHRMDFINFLFFSKRLILGAKKFWKRISLLICFLFFFPISPKGKEGGRISITSKSGPIGALTSSQKRRTRAALAPESIFKLMTSARDYGRSELSGELLSRWW